jgi:hypothetical protein
MQLAIPINLAAVVPGLKNQLSLAPVFLDSFARRRLPRGPKSARLDAQTPAHRPNGKLHAMLGHERLSHFASEAKYAVVGSTGQRNIFDLRTRKKNP